MSCLVQIAFGFELFGETDFPSDWNFLLCIAWQIETGTSDIGKFAPNQSQGESVSMGTLGQGQLLEKAYEDIFKR